MSGTYVVFRTAGRSLTLPVEDVRKVRPLGRMTRIPGTPRYVAGAMNDEGAIITVIDLAVRFGAGPTHTDDPWVVMLAAPHGGVGLLVEEVDDVVRMAADDRESPPAELVPFIRAGMVRAPQPADTTTGAGAEGRDAADWVRHTLTESAQVMGFRDIGAAADRTAGTDEAGDGLHWCLDPAKAVAGGRA